MASASPGGEDRSHDAGISATSDSNEAANIPKRPGISVVGPECEKAGITPTVLQNGWTSQQMDEPAPTITNMMVAEIEAFRTKTKATLPDAKQWLEGLLGKGFFDDVKKTSFEYSLTSRREKMNKAKQNKTPKLLDYLKQTYTKPIPRNAQPNNPEPSTSNLSQKLEAAKKSKGILQRELKEKDLEIQGMVVKNFSLEKQLEAKDRQKEKEEKRMRKKEKLLEKREAEMKESAIELNIRNWKEKLRRRDSNITKLKELAKGSKNTAAKLQQLKKDKGKGSRQLQYFKKRTRALEEELKDLKKKNKTKDKRLSQLEQEVEDLVEQALEKREIKLREGPHKNSAFTEDVRECFMALLTYEVSSHNLSKVAWCVLTILAKIKVKLSDFPGETFCQEMRNEANLTATVHVAEVIAQKSNNTIHSDGTSRDQQKVVGLQASCGGKTATMGLQEVTSGVAEEQLEAFKFTCNKMAQLTASPERVEARYNELVSSFKNTMGDGAASQKRFNQLLEEYRQEILPHVQQNWETLTTQQQESLSKMNHMYCNLHALIGFATYADEALTELETKVWRARDGPLGVEDLREFQDKNGRYSWPLKDSATQRLVRTTCSAFGPEGSQSAGRIQAFKDFLHLSSKSVDGEEVQNKKSLVKLLSFRANRFNIVFKAAAAVYHHNGDIRRLFEEGFVKADNKLLKAVLADCSCDPLLAGCRALGIIAVQITEPYWRLIEMKDVHILDLSSHLQSALAKFKQWAKDATPLLQPDMPPLFHTTQPVQPIKDEVFNSLYNNTSDNISTMTKQALEVILSHMIVVLERRFPEQLYGAYSDSSNPTQREEMKGMEKSNRRGENDFGYWSQILTTKPSISLMAAEGQLMFKTNKTAEWLRKLSKDNPGRYSAILSLVKKRKNEWKKKYAERENEQQEAREAKLQAQAEEHARKIKKKEEQQDGRKKQLEEYGGPASTPAECEEFIATVSPLPENKEKLALRAHITYLKEKHPAFAKSNSLFILSSGGRDHKPDILSANLRSILRSPELQTQSEAATEPEEATTSAPQQRLTAEDANDKVDRIKAQFAKKAAECSKQPRNVERPVEGAENSESIDWDDSEEESDAEESDAEESDAEESDAEESDAEESDAEESDAEESDAEESDAEERNAEESSEEDGEESKQHREEPPAKKQRLSDSEKDEEDEEDIVNGSMVVVAYEDDWALGEVKEVKDDGELVIKYMQRKKSKKGKCTFFWPRRGCVYTVEDKFILCTVASSSVLPNKDTLGRDSVISDDDFTEIQRKYNIYYNQYFAKGQHR
ncbi:uncharacterized protein LOC118405900 [Branchiostoma floridae]|uniref:Uncharacterized protein LOC118405900 n=1 Tax=Branchiostoma floridae TaxID=7739 RepID=A0A9J7HQN7_BRAFL|nr:uncharacterized protein LOC118405900 [Branchiostoma floridae]